MARLFALMLLCALASAAHGRSLAQSYSPAPMAASNSNGAQFLGTLALPNGQITNAKTGADLAGLMTAGMSALHVRARLRPSNAQ